MYTCGLDKQACGVKTQKLLEIACSLMLRVRVGIAVSNETTARLLIKQVIWMMLLLLLKTLPWRGQLIDHYREFIFYFTELSSCNF